MDHSQIHVPGVFYVELDESQHPPKVVSLKFTPHGSDAGYFGPSAEYVTRSSFISDIEPLDLEDTDGPFWKAVQHALEPFTCTVVTPPDEEPDEFVTTRVPIEWVE